MLTGSWDRSRRIIAKCEITASGGPNRRCVVTTLNDTPRDVYHGGYVQRGNDPERGIQELKHGLAMDRLSSHRFLTNARISVVSCGTFSSDFFRPRPAK